MTTLVPSAKDVAIPVKSANWVRLIPGETAAGSPCLYATMGQDAKPLFVLQIDVSTGACTRHLSTVTTARFPVSAMWSTRRKCLFIGSAYAGHLLRFDPKVGQVEDLGDINPEPGAASFPCRIDEHPDGSLYIGSYGRCDLTRYDPDSGAYTRFGRMDEDDMYLYPLCGRDGAVAALVKMTRPHVVALDPATGEHKAIGPVADTDKREGHVDLIKGADGCLYIQSHEGDFRIEGLAAVRIDKAPAPMSAPTLPDGSTFAFADAERFAYRRLVVTSPRGESRTLALDREGDGTDLFLVHAGPDGRVYGSSILPEHFFSYDTATGTCVDHGACSTSGGEAYSMGNLDGCVYIASYPAAKLSVYDPSRPYRFGTEPDSNPRELGRMDDVAYRPSAMVTGPAGKVWVASVPDYGMWGGTLAWYDPASDTFGSHRHILRDCSPCSLAWLVEPGLLLVGLSVNAGSGTTPRAAKAGLVLWDAAADAAVWQGDFGMDLNGVMDLCPAGGSLVYAVILEVGENRRPRLVLLDMGAKTLLSSSELGDDVGWPLGLHSLFIRGDHVYGASSGGLYRAPLGGTVLERYWCAPDGEGPSVPGAVVGNTWFFGSRHRLRTLALPGEGVSPPA